MNKGVVYVTSAGNHAKTLGFQSLKYPVALATDAFPLIPVGAVDNTGKIAPFSRAGVVYAPGVQSPCAAADTNMLGMDANGTSGGEPLESKPNSPIEPEG